MLQTQIHYGKFQAREKQQKIKVPIKYSLMEMDLKADSRSQTILRALQPVFSLDLIKIVQSYDGRNLKLLFDIEPFDYQIFSIKAYPYLQAISNALQPVFSLNLIKIVQSYYLDGFSHGCYAALFETQCLSSDYHLDEYSLMAGCCSFTVGREDKFLLSSSAIYHSGIFALSEKWLKDFNGICQLERNTSLKNEASTLCATVNSNSQKK